MIASLRGVVQDIGMDYAVIECGGIGYLVSATPRVLGTLTRGEEASLLTTMVVREDAMTIYGFESADAKDMFATLQSVSGMGPRLAMAVLATLTPAEIAQAVTRQENKTLQRVPGVGKKVADRMILELKDKVAAFATVTDTDTSGQATGASTSVDTRNIVNQVVPALVGLGFAETEAELTVESVLAENPGLDISAALRAALAVLGRGKANK